MATKIDVENSVFVRFLLISSAFVLAIFLLWKLLPALLIIAVSFFLALALNPSVHALSRRLPGNSRVLATLVSYLVVIGVVGTFIYFAVPPTVDQTTKFIEALPGYLSSISERDSWLGGLITQYNLQGQVDAIVRNIESQAVNVAGGLGASALQGVTNFFSGVVTVITVLVLTFLILVEGPRWKARAWALIPDSKKRQRYERLADKMYRVVSSYVNGQVLVALIAAIVGLVALLIFATVFNLPTSTVLPLVGIIFITDMIPMIGASVGAAIVIFVLLLTNWAAALAFLVFFIIYQQIENNFIQPMVQSRTVALTALSVFIAVIIGITLLGVVGAILAIPITGCIRVLILDYMEHRRNNPNAKRGMFKLT